MTNKKNKAKLHNFKLFIIFGNFLMIQYILYSNCLDLETNILLIKFLHSTNVNICLSYFRASFLWKLSPLFISGLGGNSSSTEKLTPVLHDDAITKLNVTTPEDSFEPFFNSRFIYNTAHYLVVSPQSGKSLLLVNKGGRKLSKIIQGAI